MESLSMQKEPPPPQLPFSAHKKQVEKRMASVGEVGGFMEGDDRDIYVTVNMCNQGIRVFPEVVREYVYSLKILI